MHIPIVLNDSGIVTTLLPPTVNNSIYKFVVFISNDTVYNIRVVLSFNNSDANRNFLKSVKTLASKCKFEFDILLYI